MQHKHYFRNFGFRFADTSYMMIQITCFLLWVTAGVYAVLGNGPLVVWLLATLGLGLVWQWWHPVPTPVPKKPWDGVDRRKVAGPVLVHSAKPKPNRRKRPKGEMKQVLDELREGATVATVSSVFGVPKQTIYYWARKARVEIPKPGQRTPGQTG